MSSTAIAIKGRDHPWYDFSLIPQSQPEEESSERQNNPLAVFKHQPQSLRSWRNGPLLLNCKLLVPYLKDYVGLFTFYYIRSALSFSFFSPSLTKEMDPDCFYQLNPSGHEKHT